MIISMMELEPSPFQRMFCGALAAVVAQTCTYPFDIVRRRMQSEIHITTPRRYTTIIGVRKEQWG